MENLCDLYFELSNEARTQILQALIEGPIKLTRLSNKLDITNQECSRHLSRLMDADLITRDSNSNYMLSPYGEVCIRLQRTQEFVTRHREYFTTRDMSEIPEKFLQRISELRDSEFIDDLLITVHLIEEMVLDSEDYIMSAVDQYPANIYEINKVAWKKGVSMKALEPENWAPPLQFIEERDAAEEAFTVARREGLLKERYVDALPFMLWVSEKVAGVMFPTTQGEFDYKGFSVTSTDGIRWCSELFNHFWESAKRRPEPFPYGNP